MAPFKTPKKLTEIEFSKLIEKWAKKAKSYQKFHHTVKASQGQLTSSEDIHWEADISSEDKDREKYNITSEDERQARIFDEIYEAQEEYEYHFIYYTTAA